jgi:hypothetical protein
LAIYAVPLKTNGVEAVSPIQSIAWITNDTGLSVVAIVPTIRNPYVLFEVELVTFLKSVRVTLYRGASPVDINSAPGSNPETLDVALITISNQ